LVRAANDLVGSANKPADKVYGSNRSAVWLRDELLVFGCEIVSRCVRRIRMPGSRTNRRFSLPAVQMPLAALPIPPAT